MSARCLLSWCTEPTLHLTREKMNLFLSLCGLLSIFALQPGANLQAHLEHLYALCHVALQ